MRRQVVAPRQVANPVELALADGVLSKMLMRTLFLTIGKSRTRNPAWSKLPTVWWEEIKGLFKQRSRE